MSVIIENLIDTDMVHSMDDFLSLHPFVRDVVIDRIRGAVIGSALGDGIGLYTEFFSKAECEAAYPDGKFTLTGNVTPFYNDYHRSKFVEGSWTDDTDHALSIILSFLHGDGKTISSLDLAKRLKIWLDQGLRCLDTLALDVGTTTRSVLGRSTYLDDPVAAAFDSWRNSAFHAAANGSLMRTYPLGLICLNKSLPITFDIAMEFSLITHADPRCSVACCIATAILRGLLRGETQVEDDLDALIDDAVAYIQNQKIRTTANPSPSAPVLDHSGNPPPTFDTKELRAHTHAPSLASLELGHLQKQGYVYKCLGSAILCLRLAMRRLQSASDPDRTPLADSYLFEELITNLVMEGGDADTNGVVAGAFLGCFLGFKLLPGHWYRGVGHIDWLLGKADAMIQVLGVGETAKGYTGSNDPDTRDDRGRGLLNKEELVEKERELSETMGKRLRERRAGCIPKTLSR